MFRFYGGQVVKKGTYWNLSSGESIELEHEKILPGSRQESIMLVGLQFQQEAIIP